ncbi:hypothetical protein F5879DRAFT_246330 [Lentinula edodes]|nr:hypothetical protein F5879DRAFT_246330 [Lentinula edodes]
MQCWSHCRCCLLLMTQRVQASSWQLLFLACTWSDSSKPEGIYYVGHAFNRGNDGRVWADHMPQQFFAAQSFNKHSPCLHRSFLTQY